MGRGGFYRGVRGVGAALRGGFPKLSQDIREILEECKDLDASSPTSQLTALTGRIDQAIELCTAHADGWKLMKQRCTPLLQ